MAILCLNLCGCMSTAAVQKARGYPAENKGGDVVPTEQPKPQYYALLPLAVPVDIAFAPFMLPLVFMMRNVH